MRINHSGYGVEPVICSRKRRFSADYDLAWGDDRAEALFASFRGGGSVVHSGTTYDITAKGPLGRVWTMNNDGSQVFRAERKGLRSSIRIDAEDGYFLLDRKHMLGSAFRLADPDDTIADFEKPNSLNGRSEISVLDIETDFLVVCFAFWLVTTIRRASIGNI